MTSDEPSSSPPRPDGNRIVEAGRLATSRVVNDSEKRGFTSIHGDAVLFSAPHAVTHCRDGEAKQDEAGTEILAAGLAVDLGVSAIWSTSDLEGDPNWDHDHPFKLHAVDLCRDGSALDLHVMMDRGFDICLGLGDDPESSRRVWTSCVDEFVRAGFTVSINHPFPAGSRTITSHLQRSGTEAIQIEMTWDVCNPDGRGPRTAEVLHRICSNLRRTAR